MKSNDTPKVEEIVGAHVFDLQEALKDAGLPVDAIQLFVSIYDAEFEKTSTVCSGTGNAFLRKALVENWILSNEEQSREAVREQNLLEGFQQIVQDDDDNDEE